MMEDSKVKGPRDPGRAVRLPGLQQVVLGRVPAAAAAGQRGSLAVDGDRAGGKMPTATASAAPAAAG